MAMLRPVALLLFIFFFFLPSFAQSSDEQVKERQRQKLILVEQVLVDVNTLKLPENRAFVYAQVGNLLHRIDDKRAREILQIAVSELIEAQTIAEADQKNAPNLQDLRTSQNLRPRILNIIAFFDAEFALEVLYKTRPPRVARALSNLSPDYAQKQSGREKFQNDSYLAQSELNLEQRLIALAADQNPERAVALLEKSMEKGITGETLNLLNKLRLKNPAKARQILYEVGEKLLKLNYDTNNRDNYLNHQNFSTVMNFLNEFIREKPADENGLQFESAQFRNLAGKVISGVLKSDHPDLAYTASMLVPIAQKLFPDSVAPLKQKQTALSRYPRHWGFSSDSEASELMQSDAPPEKLISEAGKFPTHVRRQLYQLAANKYAHEGNIASAEKILRNNLPEDELEQALANLGWTMANKAINQGNFTEALNLINQLPENKRVHSLIALAESIYRRNPQENKSFSVSVLEQAKALISDKPEDSTEMSYLLQIITKYAEIEPTEAFRLFEPLIPQINELSEASILLNGFTGGQSHIRQGEIIFYTGSPLGVYVGEIDSTLGGLVRADFNRAMQAINKFQRRETRISL
ncbi:MAG TPA: hypothetical protein VK892_15330, partial [Pyrinomonadaceae bacterium]|nr:hypothetical protein [Pyrinomonadaceae bacterium]